jgi:hypothetical protein
MHRFRTLGRGGKVLVALGVAAALFGVATAVQASIPDSSGVIHGCYQKINGQLRVIDTDKGQACLASELALSWSQTGPTGATRPTGATGATGPPGPQTPGLLLHCSAGLTLAQGICYQPLQPATNWQQAQVNCLNTGLRMPGVSETEAVLANEFFSGNFNIDEEDWTDNDSGSFLGTSVHLQGNIMSWGEGEDLPQGDQHTYRCVTPAHTNLGPSSTAPTRGPSGTITTK